MTNDKVLEKAEPVLVPDGLRGLIVTVPQDVCQEQLEGLARLLTEKFSMPVAVLNVPVEVHPVVDKQEYGIKTAEGFWMQNGSDGSIISGTKPQMLARLEASAEIYGQAGILGKFPEGCTVEPLPTE